MCGIAGFVAFDGGLGPDDDAVLARMAAQIQRRGPDEDTRYRDERLALAFTRLAILDVAGGTQPIWGCGRTAFVALNGEIYNHHSLRESLASRHTFTTGSDAEVVVHLYEELGPACLERLEGMFALAVWEPERGRLLLARDRLGIKPLYTARTRGGLLFGSELKVLLAHPECPREVDLAEVMPGWTGYPFLDRVPSFVRGVQHLGPGHLARVDTRERARELHIERYWSYGDVLTRARSTAGARTDSASHVDAYASLFDDAVTKHLQSDVPVGVFLSGGLDSSLIAAAAARVNRDLTCFSIVDPSSITSGDAVAAEAVAAANGLRHHLVRVDHERFLDEIDFSLEHFEDLVWLMDSPRLDPEWLLKQELHRYAKTVRPDLKVMLLGQGADEFAGGYSQMLDFEGGDWAGYVSSLESHREAVGFRTLRREAIDPRLHPLLSPAHPVFRGQAYGSSWQGFDFERIRRVDFLAFHNLWHEDRSAAGQGVEARVPFLDHRLVECLAQVPPELEGELFLDKEILRRVAGRYLPRAIARRPKVGFYLRRDTSFVDGLARGIVRRTLPAFRESYLQGPDAPYHLEAFDDLAARALEGGLRAGSSLTTTLGAMAAAIFQRIVETGAAGRGATLFARSHLSTLASTEGLPLAAPRPRSTEEQLVTVDGEMRFLAPLGATSRRLVVLFGDQVTRELELTEEMAWMKAIFEHLVASGAPLTVGGLASALGVGLDELHEALDFLEAQGLVVVQDP